MSIPFSGCKTRSKGVISAIAKQLRSLNFKPATKISVQFDPFHEKADTVRQFMFYITAPKYLRTNLKCTFKTNVVCDRSEPLVTVDLESGDKVVMKCNNLSPLELLQSYNKHISSLVPPAPVEEDNLKTKVKKVKRR